ncbi:MAG: hypothetical protein V7K71_05610 [Nostoc sp.]|uniref:hypothetical protein n=1 Tax=Nostoc sp. TaxID=1180 RepID=UPI002FFC7F8D
MAIDLKSVRVGQSPRRSSVANYGNRPSGDARKLANATLPDARSLLASPLLPKGEASAKGEDSLAAGANDAKRQDGKWTHQDGCYLTKIPNLMVKYLSMLKRTQCSKLCGKLRCFANLCLV